MLLDTSAWIEFFVKSTEGAKVRQVLNSQDCYTSLITISEVVNWAKKNNLDYTEFVRGIEELSIVVKLDKSIVILAGELNYLRKKHLKKWGMMDSFILATGISYNLEILTKDSDFSGMPNVRIL